jgi:hypothetical protein
MHLSVFSQEGTASRLDEYAPLFAQQGIKAYEENNWDLAIHFFKRATTFPSTSTQELWYMLIMSELYAEKYS